MSEAPLLEVKNLRLSVRTDEGLAQILDHVELALPRGQILGVVGESGCGKSTLARAVLGIVPKTATIDSGEIRVRGRGPAQPQRPRDDAARARPPHRLHPAGPLSGAQSRVQDRHPAAPGAALARAAARCAPSATRRAHLVSLLRRVQIPEPEAVLERYPHQFSGGQRQRLMIAGALACSPALVIADEPTTALDVTTQLQILKLLKSLTEEFGIAMLFVTHDFGVVAQLCDAITVMYAGQTVEAGPTREVLADPRHPYTRALLACHPDRSDGAHRHPRPGAVAAQPRRPAAASRRAARMPPRSAAAAPPRLVADAPGHLVSCRLADERQKVRRMSAGEPILEARDVVVLLGGAEAAGCGQPVPPVRAVAGVSLVAARGRDAGARRRVRAAARPRSGARCSASSARPAARSGSMARLVSGLPRRAGARAPGVPSSTCTRTPAPRSIPGGASAASWRRG